MALSASSLDREFRRGYQKPQRKTPVSGPGFLNPWGRKGVRPRVFSLSLRIVLRFKGYIRWLLRLML